MQIPSRFISNPMNQTHASLRRGIHIHFGFELWNIYVLATTHSHIRQYIIRHVYVFESLGWIFIAFAIFDYFSALISYYSAVYSVAYRKWHTRIYYNDDDWWNGFSFSRSFLCVVVVAENNSMLTRTCRLFGGFLNVWPVCCARMTKQLLVWSYISYTRYESTKKMVPWCAWW